MMNASRSDRKTVELPCENRDYKRIIKEHYCIDYICV